jgi:MFS transporter, PPP family, 3-phenylpropionic acid transporter
MKKLPHCWIVNKYCPLMKISEANKLRILYFLVFCCTAAWLPIFADYCKERGLSGTKTAIILSITPVMMFLVQPFYGMLADRLGYKKTLLFSSLLASVCYSLYLLEGNFAYLLMITVFMAVFYNTLQPVLDSLSLKLVQKNPAFSYGTLRIAGAAGWAFTGIINGQLIDALDTTVIFAVSAISMLLTFFFAFSLRTDKEKTTTNPDQSFKNVKEVFGNKILLFLLFCIFLVSAGGTTIWNFYSTYMKENGASASLVGYGLSFQGLCELPLFYFSARIIGRLGIRTTLLITVFATALRLLLYSIVKNPQAAIAIELLHGISWSLFWVVCVEYVNSLVRQDWRATGQSLLYAAYYGAGAIVGNFWTGYLTDTKMKIAEIFLLNAGIAAGVGLLIFIFMRNKKVELQKTI